MEARLRSAYESTTFIAETPLGSIRLRVGVANPLLAELLSQFGVVEWAFITACNPGSLRLSDHENTQRQRELEKKLQQDNLKIFSGAGVGDDNDWPPEPSFLVLGLKRNHAIAIGSDFGQNAIVAGGSDTTPHLVECQ